MATYNKRGYKNSITPKEEEVTVENTVEESTTAEVFNTLDETASKSEQWIEKNNKSLLIGLAIAVVAIFGYMGFNSFVVAPKEKQAADALFFAKKDFNQANASDVDSLYTLALEGKDGNYGLLDIADKYSSTKAGNLAKYYSGISYTKLGESQKAIDFLKDFSSDDTVLNAIALGAIGDAYANLENTAEALSYYTKAANQSTNEAVTPLYLVKAGKSALTLKEYSDAADFFTTVKNDYPKSQFSSNIDLLINQAKYAN